MARRTSALQQARPLWRHLSLGLLIGTLGCCPPLLPLALLEFTWLSLSSPTVLVLELLLPSSGSAQASAGRRWPGTPLTCRRSIACSFLPLASCIWASQLAEQLMNASQLATGLPTIFYPAHSRLFAATPLDLIIKLACARMNLTAERSASKTSLA